MERSNKVLSKSLSSELDEMNLCFCYFITSCSQAQRKLSRKGNDKDLFDTFIQKMAKKDLNDIGVILTNLEMIYNDLPQYIT